VTKEASLEGRVALVTAASRGIGKAIAAELAACGARVAICSSDRHAIEEAGREIGKATGSVVHAEAVDLADEEATRRFVRSAAEALGDVDVFVSNSPPLQPGPFRTISTQDWRRGFEVGFLSAATIVAEVLPAMLARGYGRLVFVGSGVVVRPLSEICVSNVVRSAVQGLCRSLVNEIGHEGVTCNSVNVANVDTERHRDLLGKRAGAAGMEAEAFTRREIHRSPVGRFGEPEEVARAVAFLASEAAGFIHGAMLNVDGGWAEISPSVE
jgi:3-oxoacyl-[acyl-carrier protein] reductase